MFSKIKSALRNFFDYWNMSEEERYLSKSVDHNDLQRRMYNIEKRAHRNFMSYIGSPHKDI